MERNTMTGKQSIRSKYLGYRNGLTTLERKEKSEQIKQRLQKETVYSEAQAVLVYMNYRSEVITTQIAEELLSAGNKKVYAPRVEGMDIYFYEIKSLSDLQAGYQGIREPESIPEKLLTEEMTRNMKCLVLVPGAVFDRERGRMGYGKGFYDRFLAKYPDVATAAAAMGSPVVKTYTPNRENQKAYEKLYADYVNLYDYFGRGGNDVMKRLLGK